MGSSPTVGRAAVALAGFCLLALALLGRAGTAAADSCPNAFVRAQQGAQGLADCRAYEMVSPLQKNNGDVRSGATGRAAVDGNGFEYEAMTAFSGAEGASHLNQYIGWRSADGWTTEALNPPVAPDAFPNTNEGYFEFTNDLTKGVLMIGHDPTNRSGDVSEDAKRVYLRTRGVPGFASLSPQPLSPGFVTEGPTFGGSSFDLNHVFFESNEQLSPEAPAFVTEAYEWDDGAFDVIGRLPNDEVAPEGAMIGHGAEGTPDSREAVSGDGTQVVLTMGSPSQLYLREDGHSKLISASQISGETGVPAPDGATFLGSRSADGRTLSTIYFVSPDALTDDAEADPLSAGGHANELYAYDVKTEELSFLSKRTNPGARPSAEVWPWWVAASRDGHYVYFAAGGKLTPGATGNNEIYLWHDGQLKAIGEAGERPNSSPSASLLSRDSVRHTESGERLLLVTTSPKSGAPLTPEAPPCAGAGCLQEVYLYDAPTDHWSCLSCSSSGPTVYSGTLRGTALGFNGLRNPYRSRNFAAGGSRVFFQTAQPLVPRDTNGAADVYEWHEGKTRLISSGQGEDGASFIDASPDGHDVFIGTRESLVPEDTDKLVDAYDVRIDGGFLRQDRPSCEGDACQGAPGATPGPVAPASSGVAAPGNAKERRRARCTPSRKAKKKGKAKAGARRARAGSRCLKQRQAKKHKRGKHKAGAKKHRVGAKGRGGSR